MEYNFKTKGFAICFSSEKLAETPRKFGWGRRWQFIFSARNKRGHLIENYLSKPLLNKT